MYYNIVFEMRKKENVKMVKTLSFYLEIITS